MRYKKGKTGAAQGMAWTLEGLGQEEGEGGGRRDWEEEGKDVRIGEEGDREEGRARWGRPAGLHLRRVMLGFRRPGALGQGPPTLGEEPGALGAGVPLMGKEPWPGGGTDLGRDTQTQVP